MFPHPGAQGSRHYLRRIGIGRMVLLRALTTSIKVIDLLVGNARIEVVSPTIHVNSTLLNCKLVWNFLSVDSRILGLQPRLMSNQTRSMVSVSADTNRLGLVLPILETVE